VLVAAPCDLIESQTSVMSILEHPSQARPDQFQNTLAGRFEQQVAARPNELAIVADNGALTYRALDARASSVAWTLASHGSKEGRPVLLYMKDDVARLVAMLGAAKANRIFIPVAPNSPAPWIRQIIDSSGSTLVVADQSTSSIRDDVASRLVSVIELDGLAAHSNTFVCDHIPSGDEAAFITFTSGSTGQPKGVTNSHRAFLHNCDVRISLAGASRMERHANFRSTGLLSWMLNSFSPLFSGACLFPFDFHRHGLQKLAPWINAEKITFASFSSSLLRTWLASLSDDLRFPTLRFVGATGDKIYGEDLIRLARHLEDDWRIGYSYASSEAGTIAARTFSPTSLPDVGTIAVGRPVDGVEVSITNEAGAQVPQGEVGEITVRSRFLAQGYWCNPDLTATAFQADPIDPAIRIYRTRDLGRWRDDGMLEHIGRKERRIRLRGYSIEPYEIERELVRESGISEAVVQLHQRAEDQEPSLVAYVVATPSTVPSLIRGALLKRLPSYMVPSHVVVLDALPLATSGKIDLSALPSPYSDKAHSPVSRTPSNDCEQKLHAIWQEALKSSDIGIDDDFFEIGGTSLQALMVFAKIEARLGCNLSPTTIVQAPTIARLAEFIQAFNASTTSQSLIPLRTTGEGLPLFLVHGRHSYVMHYRYLVSDLTSERPVFGLQPPPLDGKHHISRTIQAMAADYIKEMRRIQPHGPYLVAGHSFGGRVSFEIAQQLICAGERVSFLGLIDTVFHDTNLAAREPELVRLGRKAQYVEGFRDLISRGFRYVWRALMIWPDHVRLRLRRSIPHNRRPTYYEWICRRANRKYLIEPYAGHITIFSCKGNCERQIKNWTPIARRGLTVLEVPAGHDDMILAPHSKILARHFDSCLAAIDKTEDHYLSPAPTT